MAATEDKIARKVVPRWRPFDLTAALGELGSAVAGHSRLRRVVGDLEDRVSDWNDNRSLSFAADLVGAAVVDGTPERAHDAAKYILALGDDAPVSARTVARAALGLRALEAAGSPPTWESQSQLRSEIRRLRARLREAPRNPVLWVDLSRAYTLSGQREPATSTMHMALRLAPRNRFVLRSAARLFLHIRDADAAYKLLRDSDVTSHDPWLMAAEIALASAAERSPRFVREGKRELDRGAVPPLHISELASAIATVEMGSGKHRQARQLFRDALRDPTDNALAQAQWASQRDAGLVITEKSLEAPRTFEARSQIFRSRGEWRLALREARYWLYDEPFSGMAAAHASYLASVPLEEYEQAAEFARVGLIAKPGDTLLLNNLTFALASSGRLNEAEATFATIPAREFEGEISHRIALRATAGLLHYRRGRIREGRTNYLQALELGVSAGDKFRASLASLYHAREAMLAGSDEAMEIWKAAAALSKEAIEPELAVLRKRQEPATP